MAEGRQPFVGLERARKAKTPRNRVILLDVGKQEGDLVTIATSDTMMAHAILDGAALIEVDENVEHTLRRHRPELTS